MAKKSLKAENKDLLSQIELVREQIINLKKERMRLAAWVHTKGGDVNQIVSEPERGKDDTVDIF